MLMAWCFSTRASVATVLTTHPCVSRCLRVNLCAEAISFKLKDPMVKPAHVYSPIYIEYSIILKQFNIISEVLWQKQVSRPWKINNIPQILWDMITCPCSWYLLLAHYSRYIYIYVYIYIYIYIYTYIYPSLTYHIIYVNLGPLLIWHIWHVLWNVQHFCLMVKAN